MDPPTIEELQKDVQRQERLKENVALLDQQYQEERLQLAQEAERVAQLDAPKQLNKEGKQAPYPSQSNPAVVPTSTAETGHPPSQEFGASIPKAMPKEGVFPGMAEDSPERQQMATALDDTANKLMGKEKKEEQIRSGEVSQGKFAYLYHVVFPTCYNADFHTFVAISTVKRGKPSEPIASPPGTPVDSYKPEAWKPTARRRGKA
jgi:hypothetical protein